MDTGLSDQKVTETTNSQTSNRPPQLCAPSLLLIKTEDCTDDCKATHPNFSEIIKQHSSTALAVRPITQLHRILWHGVTALTWNWTLANSKKWWWPFPANRHIWLQQLLGNQWSRSSTDNPPLKFSSNFEKMLRSFRQLKYTCSVILSFNLNNILC